MNEMNVMTAQKGFLGVSIGRQEEELAVNEMEKRKDAVLNRYEKLMKSGSIIPEIIWKVYQIMFLSSLGGHMLVGSLHFSLKDSEWMLPLAEEIIGSYCDLTKKEGGKE